VAKRAISNYNSTVNTANSVPMILSAAKTGAISIQNYFYTLYQTHILLFKKLEVTF